MEDLLLRIIYAANVFVAGAIGVSALFTPMRAVQTVFEGAVAPSEGLRVTGALWLAIAILSAVGLLAPKPMQPVLVLQIVYKGSWLLVAGLPAMLDGRPYPAGIFWFFVVWVAVLPWVVDWRGLVGAS